MDNNNHGLSEKTDRPSSRGRLPDGSANPIDIHVGNRIRSRRALLGISQEKLAKELGVTFQQIQKYERGMNRMGSSRLWDMAQVLGVSVNFFSKTWRQKLRRKVRAVSFYPTASHAVLNSRQRPQKTR